MRLRLLYESVEREVIEQRRGLFTESCRILGVLQNRHNMKTLSVLHGYNLTFVFQENIFIQAKFNLNAKLHKILLRLFREI